MPTRLSCYWWNYMPGDQCWLSGEWLGRSVCALSPCQDEGQRAVLGRHLSKKDDTRKHAVFMSRNFVCNICVCVGGWGGVFQNAIAVATNAIQTSILMFFACFLGSSKGKRLKKIINRTQNYLNLYAADGLRTLCIAKKVTGLQKPPRKSIECSVWNISLAVFATQHGWTHERGPSLWLGLQSVTFPGC